jgi:hypothetical protein
MLSDFLLLAPAAFVFVILLLLSRRDKGVREVTDADDWPPKNAIVVDGSNVLHWGGKPSIKVLSKVLSLIEKQGFTPMVYFDANAGYQIGDRYLDEQALAGLIDVRVDHIRVVDKGIVADEMILTFATDHGLRIVTNDKYRDWRGQFPHAGQKKVLVAGKWNSGNPVLRF